MADGSTLTPLRSLTDDDMADVLADLAKLEADLDRLIEAKAANPHLDHHRHEQVKAAHNHDITRLKEMLA